MLNSNKLFKPNCDSCSQQFSLAFQQQLQQSTTKPTDTDTITQLFRVQIHSIQNSIQIVLKTTCIFPPCLDFFF